MSNHHALFDIKGQTAVITGGGGVLGRVMALGLAQTGANVVVISRRAESCGKIAQEIHEQGGSAISIACDVTNRADLERAHAQTLNSFGGIDILVNAAGGNQAQATTSADRSFFELDSEAINMVLKLNLTGTILSCQVFGKSMVEQGHGCIVNIASMASLRPLTRVATYGAAKAAVVNFTQWLAVHMAQEYSVQIRVNAISPGFFLTEQNRFLLTEAETGTLTARGQTILNHTPMKRFGTPEDLIGVLLWLVSPASTFVTGTVIPIDGGFSAFSGV